MSFETEQEIFIKNKKEADIVWGFLRKKGYCWNSGKKDFCYYGSLPLVIQVLHNKKLSYGSGMRETSWMLTIDDFKTKNISLELE